MAVESPAGVVKGVDTPAEVQRHVHQALAGAPVGSFAGGVSAFGMAHGICYPDAFAVSESDTPAMSVDVAAGIAMCTGTVSAVQGPYTVYNPSSVTKTVAAADSTNPRYDLVVVRPLDPEFSGTPGEYDPDVFVVTGTPAAEPSDPSLSSHPNALVLARIEVGAGVSSITDSDITDLRTPARASAWYQAWGTIGYSTATAQQSGITSETDLTGLSVTFAAVAGRRYEVTGSVYPQSSVAGDRLRMVIANGSNTRLQVGEASAPAVNVAVTVERSVVLSGLSGATTVKLRLKREAGTGTLLNVATPDVPSFILVKDAGPA